MLVADKLSDDPHVKVVRGRLLDLPGHIIRRRLIRASWRRYRKTRPRGLEFFSDDRSPFRQSVKASLPEADIINLHWVAGFVDYNNFFSGLQPGKPIVWTLHDMNPFTGGCHYNAGCERFHTECGRCPQLGSSHNLDLANQIFHRKRAAYSKLPKKDQLQIVTPSLWLAKEAATSKLFSKFKINVIPNGLSTEIFQPRSKSAARQMLGLHPAAKVILFVSAGIKNSRKGLDLLLAALNDLPDIKGLCLMTVGRGTSNSFAKFPHVTVGAIGSEYDLSFVYSAADIFVVPSRQDNLPNTVLEALACGTPVVGFSIGGIPEVVRPDRTGALVQPENVRELRESILSLIIDDGKRMALSANCRRTAVEEFDSKCQADRYVELYRSLIARPSGSVAS